MKSTGPLNRALRTRSCPLLRFLAVQSSVCCWSQVFTWYSLASVIVLTGACDPISNVVHPGLLGLALLSNVFVTL